jgi:zinc carboxypeptidase
MSIVYLLPMGRSLTRSCYRAARIVAAGVMATALIHCAGSRTPRTSREARTTAPRTQAERTNYRETSTYAQVVAFIDSLKGLGRPILTGSIGRTIEGRELPYVIASRPLFATPDAARRSGRPIVYVQGNIHAGEVEGKEALLALVRDLLLDPRPNVLDSIVVIAQPVYNADGNERFAPQARNRGAQNGPEMVGTRANAQNYNLNRDYMKLDAPESRGAIAMFTAWDPHVFVDLHTTDGSYHGYNLTYAPSLSPAAEIAGVTSGGLWAHDSLLPELRRRLAARAHVSTFDYGDFNGGNDSVAVSRGWFTFEHTPRYGTNYYGLRGRIGILSEAYSHDPFETRVRSTYAFVKELLSLVAERRSTIIRMAQQSDAALRAGHIPPIPVRATRSSNRSDDVIYEELEPTTDTTRREPGVRAGMRRTGRYHTLRIPIYDRFTPTVTRPAPWGYAIAPSDTSAVNIIRLQGIAVDRLGASWRGDAGPQFQADSTVIDARAFEPQAAIPRREVRLVGHWQSVSEITLAPGTWIVRTAQPLGVLVMYLLEPESDDGVVTWDIGGRAARTAGTAPIVRLAVPVAPIEQKR